MLNELPNFSRLKDNGLLIKDCLANSLPTYLAFPMIFSSKSFLTKQFRIGYPKKLPNLVGELRMNQVKTYGNVNGNAWLSRTFGYSEFFDSFQDNLNLSNNQMSFIERLWKKVKRINSVDYIARYLFTLFNKKLYDSSKKVISKLVNSMRQNNNDKSFYWAHLMDLHYPWFTNSISVRLQTKVWKSFSEYHFGIEKFKNSELKKIGKIGLELYKEKLQAIDDALSEIIDLIETPEIEDIMLVIASDHGTHLGEKNILGHGPWETNEELVRLPLIVYSKKKEKKLFETEICEQIDIAPTILDYFEINPPSTWEGQSFFCPYKKKPRYCSFQYNFDPFKKATMNNDFVVAVDYLGNKFTIDKHNNKESYNNSSNQNNNHEIISEMRKLTSNYLKKLYIRERVKNIKKTKVKS